MSNPIPTPEALAVNPSPKWDGGDAASLRNFFDKNPRFLASLAHRTPAIDTASVERAALTGAAHAGYEALFKALTSMASEQNAEQPSPYIEGDHEEET